MIKQSIYFEVKRGERTYQFHLAPDSPLGEVHDALFEMRSYVIDKINAAQNSDKPKEPEQPKE